MKDAAFSRQVSRLHQLLLFSRDWHKSLWFWHISLCLLLSQFELSGHFTVETKYKQIADKDKSSQHLADPQDLSAPEYEEIATRELLAEEEHEPQASNQPETTIEMKTIDANSAVTDFVIG